MNEIIDEIHHHRAEHARDCGYDMDVIFARMRDDLDRLQQEGWKVVTLPPRRRPHADSGTMREDPPVSRVAFVAD